MLSALVFADVAGEPDGLIIKHGLDGYVLERLHFDVCEVGIVAVPDISCKINAVVFSIFFRGIVEDVHVLR